MMKAITTLLAGGAALALAAPAQAQYFPGYGYGYGNGYGATNQQMVVNQCASAVQQRLGGGGYGYGYGNNAYGGRVLGISRVEPLGYGGFIVRGVATSGRYAGYGEQRPDLTWRCRSDFRGFITEVTVRPAQPSYGYGQNYNYGYGQNYNYNNNSSPWGEQDYSQYGYQRY